MQIFIKGKGVSKTFKNAENICSKKFYLSEKISSWKLPTGPGKIKRMLVYSYSRVCQESHQGVFGPQFFEFDVSSGKAKLF